MSFAASSSSPALTVTVWAVLQRSSAPLGLNVREVVSSVRSVPACPVMATVTVAEGWVASLTV